MSRGLPSTMMRAAWAGAVALGLAATSALSLRAEIGPKSEPAATSLPQPESNRLMAEMLAGFIQTDDPFKSPFRTREVAEALREQLARTTDPSEQLRLKLPVAQRLMQAGKLDEALREFEDYDRLVRESGRPLNALEYTLLTTSKGMCHLRIGELENCLADHNADSCLFPIRGGGVHRLPRGSREAISEFTTLLQRYPGDLRARWLLNLAYMTLDEHPDKVPPEWLIKPGAFDSEHDIQRFTDVAGVLGVDVDDLSGGVVLDDFDNDGFLDLMVSASGLASQLRYFRNNGDGTFADLTASSGLTGETGGLNLIQGDYNNDGLIDVLVLRGGWRGEDGLHPDSLLRNNGDNTFTDVTVVAGLLSFHPNQTAAWFDYNGDGWLDIFVGNESTKDRPDTRHPCQLFRNNADGTFTECAAAHGAALEGYVKGVVSGDFNNDGRPDLYVSRHDGANYLLRNDGPATADRSPKAPWKFTNVASSAGVTEPFRSFSCWFWDYDNDGWPDLMCTGYLIEDAGNIAADYLGLPDAGVRPHLYRNRGDGTFADVTKEAGVFTLLHAMGCNFGDLDNDGWLDFYVGTGDPDFATLIPNRMFRNEGGERFQDVTTSGGFGHLQKGHGIAFGDIDNDGDQDIYSVLGGAIETDNYPNQLLANPGHGNRWLKLKLEGVQSNRVALGARIKVVVNTVEGERTIHRTVGSGGSFGASPLRQEFGLGDALGVVRVEIFWPVTGITQIIRDMEVDQGYLIREGASAAIPWSLKSFSLPTSSDGAHHHHHVTGS